MPKTKMTRMPTSRPATTAKRARATQSNETDPLVTAAATVGKTLGQLAGRVDAWDKQRAELIAEVQRLVAHGQDILKRLGHHGDAADASDTGATHVDSHSVMPPDRGMSSHRVNPTAGHDMSVIAKAQHASERTRPRAAYRSQNR
jgi:hypothetical protein